MARSISLRPSSVSLRPSASCWRRTRSCSLQPATSARSAAAAAAERADVAGWSEQLRVLRQQLADGRKDTDDGRREMDRAILQDYRPLPADPAEQALYAQQVGTSGDGIPSRVRALVDESLGWHYGEHVAEGGQIYFKHPSDSDGVVRKKTDPTPPIKAVDLLRAVYPLLDGSSSLLGTDTVLTRGLQRRSVLDVMLVEHDGDAEACGDWIAARVKSHMPRLAAFNATNALTGADQLKQQDNDYLCAAWPSEGAAKVVADRLRGQLAQTVKGFM